jgi:hypothetical protein
MLKDLSFVPRLQKPDRLTTSGRFRYNYHKLFKNNHLIPAKGGQLTPAEGGQCHWLFYDNPPTANADK